MAGDWTKSRWRRTAVIRRRSQGHSVSSDSPTEKMVLHSSGSDEAIAPPESNEDTARTPAEITAEEKERVQKAQRKLKFIMLELLETEKQYVQGLEECINGYMKEMQSPNLPDALKGKEKLIFGNIQAVYDFHHGTFVKILEEASESPEDIAKCFLNQAHMFEVYVTYCENKPMSESFLWTFHHNGGTFFEEVKTQLGHRQDIDSYLIKPVQRITRYKLLLGDLYRSAQKAEMETPILERALSLMEDVPKRANDAMTLSMIYGYEGNIHSSGQIILQDEFTVFERSRWTGAKRQLFLLEQRLVITKEKGDDGMYQYKDSLKVHNLSLAEKEGDSPVRFAVGTGPIGSWDQFYILEASSVEKKQQWLQVIKDILKQQFELLKALKQPNTRPKSKIADIPDPDTVFPDPKSSVAMINLSDDSEEEFAETQVSPGLTPWSHNDHAPHDRRTMSLAAISTVGEPTPAMPSLKSRAFNLYIVAEDCAPPKENEGILFVHKGQVYDIIDSASDWWFARLVRDITPSPGGTRIAQQGWVPGSFLDKFEGELTAEEETAFNTAVRKIQLKKQRAASDSPRHEHKSVPRKQHQKLRITNSHTFQEEPEREEEEEEEEEASSPLEELPKPGEPPTLISHLSNETVIAGHTVQLQCRIKEGVHPMPNVEWTHNHQPVNIERAFTNFGEESCVIRIKSVQASDEGMYTCTIWNKHGVATTSAHLTVLSPPNPPGKPTVKPLTSTSVSLSWEPPPSSSSHSTIKLYLVECKDTISNRWSTLMKRITEPSLVIDDLMPGVEYAFRVMASNQVGLSEPSAESEGVELPRLSEESDFLLEPFEHRYQLLEEIGRGQYGTVYKCLHNATQQTYAAKLIPLEIGKDNARHELDILDKLSHPNILPVTSAYVTQTHFVILFPHYSGVNVLEYFVRHDCLSEHAAARCVGQVLAGLCYLHESNIAHLDIRPENIMTMELVESSIPEVKLINLERAREITESSDIIMKKMDANIEYEAPEILTGEPVSMVTDVWSLGVLLYILLCGTSPFLVDSVDLTKDNILSVRYSFHVKYFKEVSNNAKDLVAKMIVKEKSDRLSSTQCLNHPWLASKSPKLARNLNTARLKSYLTSRKWQHSLGGDESSIV